MAVELKDVSHDVSIVEELTKKHLPQSLKIYSTLKLIRLGIFERPPLLRILVGKEEDDGDDEKFFVFSQEAVDGEKGALDITLFAPSNDVGEVKKQDRSFPH